MLTGFAFHRVLSAALIPLVMVAGFSAALPGESVMPDDGAGIDSEFFGIVGLDPWYTFDADKERYPNDVNRALLERMASDMARMGARWVRIEFHAEQGTATEPGAIDFGKYDWFINELAPRYGLRVLAMLGSGLIGESDPHWGFERINDPLTDAGSNPYIDLYVERVGEIVLRYGNRLGAVEVLNEPNANEILSAGTYGIEKSVWPSHYGELLSRVYSVVKQSSPETAVITGGVLFDDEAGTSYSERGRSHDMDWLEGMYASRPVMRFMAEHGHPPFDAVGVHPYFLEPHEIVDYLQHVHELQRRFGDDSGRIWITEVGTPADPPEEVLALGLGLPSASERRQAAFLSATFTSIAQLAPFVERVFWFKYEDFPHDGQFNGWGLVRLEGSHLDYGALSNPWPRKFAYSVYQALANPVQMPVVPVKADATPPKGAYFLESGHTLADPFLAYWNANGGRERFGLPVTEPFIRRGRLVQYFERAEFEYFPEHVDAGWGVQLGLVGKYIVDAKDISAEINPIAGDADHFYFPETGQSVQGDFRSYWEQNGGLRSFGYPLTPELVEDGRVVQYFERSRLELVPRESGDEVIVQLGDIGLEALSIPGWYR